MVLLLKIPINKPTVWLWVQSLIGSVAANPPKGGMGAVPCWCSPLLVQYLDVVGSVAANPQTFGLGIENNNPQTFGLGIENTNPQTFGLGIKDTNPGSLAPCTPTRGRGTDSYATSKGGTGRKRPVNQP